MTVENKTPYVIVSLLFVIGLCVAGAFMSALAQFTPQDWAEMAGLQAEIPERVEHLETMNDIEERIAQGVQGAEIEKGTAWRVSSAQVGRALGVGLVLLVATGAGIGAYRVHVEGVSQGRERRAAANLREVQAEKGKENPAFTPAGFLTRTTTIEGETFITSDLTGDMAPVRDSERMKDFRQAHLAAMMAAIMAKRDVLLARAHHQDEKDEVIFLIGEGL